MGQQGAPPLEGYRRRLDDLARESAQAASRLRGWRVAVAAVLIVSSVLLYLSFVTNQLPFWSAALVIPLAFVAARRAARWRDKGVELFAVAEYYEKGLARLERNWSALDRGDEFADRDHLYAIDLDLFGRGSLFQLLCSARTQAGREVLARWMSTTAEHDEVLARRAAIAELRPRDDLRERFAAAGGTTASDCRPDTFRLWVSRTRALPRFPAWAPLAAVLLSLSALIVPLLLWSDVVTLRIAVQAGIVVGLLESVLGITYLPRVRAIVRGWQLPSTELAVMGELLHILEREEFSSANLRALAATVRASHALDRVRTLHRLIRWAEARDVDVFALLSHLLMWGTQFAMAVHRWHLRHGTELLAWIAAIGELEVLMSLATYCNEHPDDVFAELSQAGPLLDAEGLAHPLLDERTTVGNDLRLGQDMRFLIVSGSNMSGKSTLLRAVGLNVVLTWMGAPARCRRLRVSRLAPGAAIRVEDSVVDGRSHFFAEIDRLRRMMDVASASPLLFLIDEIMSGTNSHDRRIASAWVVRAFMAREAIGLITTHDLALTQIASGELAGGNVHFEDGGDGGQLEFDYRLRPGVVTRSNALNIVRMLGLES